MSELRVVSCAPPVDADIVPIAAAAAAATGTMSGVLLQLDTDQTAVARSAARSATVVHRLCRLAAKNSRSGSCSFECMEIVQTFSGTKLNKCPPRKQSHIGSAPSLLEHCRRVDLPRTYETPSPHQLRKNTVSVGDGFFGARRTEQAR
jgi:hypothetical protein